MNPFLAGMLVALPMTLGVGPSLLLYLQATMQRGFYAGLSVLSGIWLSDIGFVFVNYLGISHFFSCAPNQRIAAGVSASVMLIFGSLQWVRKPAPVGCSAVSAPAPRERSKATRDFFSGLIINSSNPMLLAYWVTLVGLTGANFGFRTHSFYLFLSGIFLGEILCDTAKCFLFSRITVHFNTAVLTWTNRVAGSALIIAAVVIVCKSL
jgi:threonine/homoserine/homoserine lactone efflux protein